ncbi:MAG TPA: hypothetical protein VJP02_02335, partial [Candidatus Sulfotelmatobacter sp.]|nr:hypothetical protein [Candidatus Sulfotelmatobacter sp.]
MMRPDRKTGAPARGIQLPVIWRHFHPLAGKLSTAVLVCLIAGIVTGIASCVGAVGTPNPSTGLGVTISSAARSVQVGETSTFSAVVGNDPNNQGVTWSATCNLSSCGSFSPSTTANGVATTYTAPTSVPAGGTVSISAVSLGVSGQSATVTITITAAPPPISVSLSGQPASLQVSVSGNITATVSNDSQNKGVSWTVTCGSASCGSFSPATTASGVATSYTAPSSVPTGNTVTVKATSVADNSKSASATITITSPSGSVVVTVKPHRSSVTFSQPQLFTATVQNSGNT